MADGFDLVVVVAGQLTTIAVVLDQAACGGLRKERRKAMRRGDERG